MCRAGLNEDVSRDHAACRECERLKDDAAGARRCDAISYCAKIACRELVYESTVAGVPGTPGRTRRMTREHHKRAAIATADVVNRCAATPPLTAVARSGAARNCRFPIDYMRSRVTHNDYYFQVR